nr:hypothetical protein [Tanacetum cinerariifolium]
MVEVVGSVWSDREWLGNRGSGVTGCSGKYGRVTVVLKRGSDLGCHNKQPISSGQPSPSFNSSSHPFNCLILMTSFDYRLNPRYPIKECSSCGALYTTDYCCSNGSLVDKIICDLNKAPDSPYLRTLSSNQRHCFHCKDVLGDAIFKYFSSISANSSQSRSQINHHCCFDCGNPLEGIFCLQCTCQLCGNGAHYGYNCPPKVPIIPDPEPFNNHTIKELPPTVQSFDPKYDIVYNSPNVFSPSLQPPGYSYEFCGNDAYYGQHGSLQVPFTYDLEPCYN